MIDWTNFKRRARDFWCFPWVVVSALVLSCLGITFIIVLASFFKHVSEARAAYQAKVQAINTCPSSTTDIEFRGDELTLTRILGRCGEVIDSLDVGAQVRGYVVGADLRPPDFLGPDRPYAKVDVLLDCGCVETGVYDVLSFEIDPISLHANITRMARSLELAKYKPIQLLEGR